MPATPVCATSFEVRHLGWSLELDPVISEETKCIDVIIAPEWVSLDSMAEMGDGLSKIQSPVFRSLKLNTALTFESGKPLLVGSYPYPESAESGGRIGPDGRRVVILMRVTTSP